MHHIQNFVRLLAMGSLLLIAACDDPTQPPQETKHAETPAQVELVAPDHFLDENIVYVIDGSGSMSEKECSGNESKLEVAKKAVKGSIDAQPPEVNQGLVAFDAHGGPRIIAPLRSGDRTAIRAGVDSIDADGQTPLYHAIELGNAMLLEQMHRQNGYGLYTLAIVTDGEANQGGGPYEVANLARNIVTAHPIRVAALGFCMTNHSLNIPGYTLYVTVNNPADLRKGLAEATTETLVFDTTSFRR